MDKVSTKTAITCEDCQLAIIAGTADNDPQLQEHLKNCSDCRDFAAFQQEVLTAEPEISGKIPEFAAIKNAAAQRKRSHNRFLRLAVVPISMAAALTLVLGGVFFHQHLEENDSLVRHHKKIKKPHFAAAKHTKKAKNLNDFYMVLDNSESFAVMLEESSVVMAWDRTSTRETQCRKSMQAARSGDEWNIEIFNPYSEE